MPAPTTEVDAFRYLERMLQWNVAPTLTSAEVQDLYALAKVDDIYGYEPDSLVPWAATTAYTLNSLVRAIDRNGFSYQPSVAGTSGGVEPAWPTVLYEVVVDGTVTWITVAKAPWTPTFNLPAAAAEGWEWKAGKVAGQFDAKAGSVDAKRSKVFEMCKQQAARYRAMSSGPASGFGVITLGQGW